MKRIGLGIGLSATLCCAGALHGQDASPPTPVPAGIVSDGELGQPFATRNAVFEPRPFADLPGWAGDDLSEAADGMRQTCKALRRKPVWQSLCAQFDATAPDPAALHAFFERNFHAYQVMSPAREPTGKLTGYFEPLLEGSLTRDERFRYPVYGVPADMMLLDAGNARAPSAWLYRDGLRLRAGAPGDGRSRQYAIDLSGGSAGVRDKRYRVRIDGDRITAYPSRQQIERSALPAPVLAWVDDAQRLYSMQIQGSGKVRLQNGGLVRLAYAEQNGHPFRPRVTRGGGADLALLGIKARGLIPGGSAGASKALAPDPRLPAGVNDEVARMIALLKGGSAPPPAPRPPAAPTRPAAATAGGAAPRPVPGNRSEIDAMIAALKGEGPPPPPRPVGTPAPAAPPPPVAAYPPSPGGASAGTQPSPHAGGTTGIPDPSYVFFRSIGDGPEGPIGALGVPLSAGRSLAVDPRSTPLGAPVFISSQEPGSDAPMQRLMFAQDTGGAIRGSVRADFFWGFGDAAGRLALATNDAMRMWLLLPREQPINAVAAKGMRLRGAARQQLPDCVIPDPDLCVEDPDAGPIGD